MKAEYTTIRELGTRVIAISRNSIGSHIDFCDKLGGCPFPLASDSNLRVARLYGALENDDLTSRRTILIIDETGVIIHKIPRYQPDNMAHFIEVFRAIGLE